MKILISNYSSPESTEPIYLNTAFNAAGCMSTLWPSNISTFDIFDFVQPDIHLTHHSRLSMDLVLYLKEYKNLDLIINITGLNQLALNSLEQKLSEYKIKPSLFFVNHYDHNLKSNNTNIISLLHGADLFFGQSKKYYTIDYGIIVDNKNVKQIGETYHYISTSESLQKDIDICLPINSLVKLFGNYNNIVLQYFNGIVPQVFFDAAYYNNNVYFDIEDRSTLDVILNKMLGDGKHCDLQQANSGNIKDKILKKHTCFHRAKSILSQLPCKEYTDKLQSIMDEVLK